LLFMDRRDDALPVLANLSRRFDDFGLIEKMIPTAMQEVPVMLKGQLIVMYLTRRNIPAAAREAVSLAFNIPVSFEIYHRIGQQLDKKVSDSPHPQALIFIADIFFNRMARLRPDDPETRKILADHYLRTGRPHLALQVEQKHFGVSGAEDIEMNVLFAYAALQQDQLDDYRLIRRRMRTLNPAARFDEALFKLILSRRDDYTLFVYLKQLPESNIRKDLCLRAVKYFADLRDYSLLTDTLKQFSDGGFQSTAVEKKTMAGYYEMLGMEAYRRENLPAALEFYKQAGALDPGNTGVLFNLAVLYSENGKARQAADVLKRLLALDPGDKQARNLLDEMERKLLK
jgi:tetratricopeptide (TPR) repeat protein